jgi:hypothetical protein
VQHVLTSDVSIGTTPADGHTLVLPAAGQWTIELADAIEAGALAAQRDVTWQIVVTNLVTMSAFVVVVRNSASAVPSVAQTVSGASHVLTGIPTSSGRGRCNASGIVNVSAAAVITTPTFMSAETANLKTGSYLRARKYA